MSLISIIIVLFILSVWVFTAGQRLWSAKGQAGWRRWLMVAGAILMAVGAFGFFGTALSAIGGLNWLPASFEWPVGFAKGVVATSDHFFIVPHTASGRVQVYDGDWKFLRGWPVDAGGGVFKLRTTRPDQVEVFTARGDWHYVYDLSGRLLLKETYSRESDPFSETQGQAYYVPTRLWLWVFSNPFFCWASAGAGMGLVILAEKLGGTRKLKAKG